jgi:hypothetical protein
LQFKNSLFKQYKQLANGKKSIAEGKSRLSAKAAEGSSGCCKD